MPSKKKGRKKHKRRKLYETAKDRKNEREIISVVEESWGVEVQALPRKYSFDFCIVQDVGGNFNERYEIQTFCEIKNRSIKMTDYEFIVVELTKYFEAIKVYESTEIPTYLFYKFTDGLYYHEFGKINKPFYKYTMGGRKDRNDPQDHTPQLLIPTDMLIKV